MHITPMICGELTDSLGTWGLACSVDFFSLSSVEVRWLCGSISTVCFVHKDLCNLKLFQGWCNVADD